MGCCRRGRDSDRCGTRPRGGHPLRGRHGVGGSGVAAFGAVRVLVIAAVLGTTYLGNTFQSSNSVSNVLFELLAAGALSAVLVPTFVQHLNHGDRSGAESLARELLGVAVIVLGAVSLVGLLASGWIADLLTAAVEDPAVRAAQRDLSRFLLWFFIPQVLLYAWGSISTAVLHAQRRFVVPAVAPIGNTLVMVAFLVAFAVVAGADPGLELSSGEKLLLAGAGTLGVLAFVAIPTAAAWRHGFRLVPRFTRRHEGLPEDRQPLGLGRSATRGGCLLAGCGHRRRRSRGGRRGRLSGGMVLLPRSLRHRRPAHPHRHPPGAGARARSRRRWSLRGVGALVVGLDGGAVGPPERPVRRARRTGDVGAGLRRGGHHRRCGAARPPPWRRLCLGLVPYGAFFLLARAWYVLEDSRRPAMAGICGAAVGVAAMGLSAWLLPRRCAGRRARSGPHARVLRRRRPPGGGSASTHRHLGGLPAAVDLSALAALVGVAAWGVAPVVGADGPSTAARGARRALRGRGGCLRRHAAAGWGVGAGAASGPFGGAPVVRRAAVAVAAGLLVLLGLSGGGAPAGAEAASAPGQCRSGARLLRADPGMGRVGRCRGAVTSRASSPMPRWRGSRCAP